MGPLDPFLRDPRIYATPHSGLRIAWMGYTTSIIEIDGMRTLIDGFRAADFQKMDLEFAVKR